MVHKTISIQYKPTKTERHLFEFLTRESKHVYNITIFCYKFIDMFKSRIYKELHDYITDFVKIKKNIKKSSIETINAKLYEVINKKYEYYMSIKEQKQVNNDLIYQHIIKSIKDNNFTVTNNNYFQLVEHYIKELEPLVKTDKINKFDLLDNIVTNLLKSIYIKNFYHVKYAMINHTALKITNSVFINQVKKNEFLF